MDRQLQLELWECDVFVCHAGGLGGDKPFARALARRIPKDLRWFVDEDSLTPGSRAPWRMEAAARTSQIAVVLLSKRFFRNAAPQKELRWILENVEESKTTIVPVFLGITVEEYDSLANGTGLEAVSQFTGLRHVYERRSFNGIPVDREETLWCIVDILQRLTGIWL